MKQWLLIAVRMESKGTQSNMEQNETSWSGTDVATSGLNIDFGRIFWPFKCVAIWRRYWNHTPKAAFRVHWFVSIAKRKFLLLRSPLTNFIAFQQSSLSVTVKKSREFYLFASHKKVLLSAVDLGACTLYITTYDNVRLSHISSFVVLGTENAVLILSHKFASSYRRAFCHIHEHINLARVFSLFSSKPWKFISLFCAESESVCVALWEGNWPLYITQT